jgi:hypothetical protein
MSLKQATQLAEEGDYKGAYEALLEYIEGPEDNEWIVEWNDMWPTPGKLYEEFGVTIDYSPKQAITSVMTRMKAFMKNFRKLFPDVKPKDRVDLIMRATEAYLKNQEDKDWAFTKKSTKFIQDNNGSTLAEYIDGVINGQQQTQSKRTINW